MHCVIDTWAGRSVLEALKCIVCRSCLKEVIRWEHMMAAELCLSVLSVNILRCAWVGSTDERIDEWMMGGRAGLNATRIHYPCHSEELWGSWGCLWVCLCHRTASWGRGMSEELLCMTFEDSRLNYYLPAPSSTHSMLLFWASVWKTKTALLSVLSLRTLVSFLRSWKIVSVSLCYHQAKSPFVCKRWIQESQSLCDRAEVIPSKT